jgi:hypothetical protein
MPGNGDLIIISSKRIRVTVPRIPRRLAAG